MSNPMAIIRRQINASKADLDAYLPKSMGWHGRALQTSEMVVPWLCQNAGIICGFVQEVCNSPGQLRLLWENLRKQQDLGNLGTQINRLLGYEMILVSEIAGDVVSRVLTDYIIGIFPKNNLKANGKSDFPDLYLNSKNYAGLPLFSRSNTNFGAAMKGGRPARVPDGIEIKTCGPTVRVDCHHPHMGLHIALCQTGEPGNVRVVDLMAGFLRSSDYRESKRATTATTVKFSFGSDKFVSMLSEPRSVT